jgi:hypothetical protein
VGATELTRRPCAPQATPQSAPFRKQIRRIAGPYMLLWALTLAAIPLGAALPGLAPGGRPHPTLHGTPGELASIAATNARVLSAPFLLLVFRFACRPAWRRLGDAIVGLLLGVNAARVGLAVGRDGPALIPYVPHVPVEWLAAATSAAAWLTFRAGGASRRTTIGYAAAVLTLVAIAATVETACTPHATAKTPTSHRQSARKPRSPVRASVRNPGGGLPAPDHAPAPALPTRSLTLPSPRIHSVPFGRFAGAPRLRQPPPDPTRRDQQ